MVIDAKGHPKISDPDLADREWAENTNEIKRHLDPKAAADAVSRAKGGNGVTRAPTTKPSSFGGSDGGDGGGSTSTTSPLNKARAAKETYEARIAEFKYRKMKDELVDASEVRSQFATASRRVRDSILAVPDRIASILAAEQDPDRVHRLLIEELEQTLTSLADEGRAADG